MTRDVADSTSPACIEFLGRLYRNSSRFYDPYYDATGKYSSHFTNMANSLWFGDINQCLSMESSRYCILDLMISFGGSDEVIPKSRHDVKWGLCVPGFCETKIINESGKLIFENFFGDEYKWMKPEVSTTICMDPVQPAIGYYVVGSLLLLLFLFYLVSTIVVIKYEKRAQMKYSFIYRVGSTTFEAIDPPNHGKYFYPKGLADLVENVSCRNTTNGSCGSQGRERAIQRSLTMTTVLTGGDDDSSIVAAGGKEVVADLHLLRDTGCSSSCEGGSKVRSGPVSPNKNNIYGGGGGGGDGDDDDKRSRDGSVNERKNKEKMKEHIGNDEDCNNVQYGLYRAGRNYKMRVSILTDKDDDAHHRGVDDDAHHRGVDDDDVDHGNRIHTIPRVVVKGNFKKPIKNHEGIQSTSQSITSRESTKVSNPISIGKPSLKPLNPQSTAITVSSTVEGYTPSSIDQSIQAITGGGDDNDSLLSAYDDVDDEDGSTFGPPNQKLLRKAFQYRPGCLAKICYIFCLKSNLSKIIKHTPTEFHVIHCLKVLSFWTLLLAQLYLTALKFDLIDNSTITEEYIKGFIITYLVSCYPLALDALFFASGFTFVDRNATRWHTCSVGACSLIFFYIRRYLRLILPLAVVLLATVYLVPYWTTCSGPQSFKLESLGRQCSSWWWTLLAALQNYHPTWNFENQNECLQWTWFVAIQWQISILSPLALVLVVRRTFIIIGSLATIISLSLVAFVIGYFHLRPDLIGSFGTVTTYDEVDSYMAYVMTKPYTWMTSYVIGAMLACKLLQHKLHGNNNNNDGVVANWFSRLSSSPLCIHKAYTFIIWLFCLLALILFFGLNYTSLDGTNFNNTGNAFYGSLIHLIWSAVLSWVVYASYHGNAGIISWFSSWRIWSCVSRLTYSAYLVHGLVLMYVCSKWTTTILFDDHFSIFIIYISSMVLSYIFGLLVYLLVEAPILNLPKPFSKD